MIQNKEGRTDYTQVRQGDVVVLDKENQTLKIFRLDYEKKWQQLKFQAIKNGNWKNEKMSEKCFRGDSSGITAYDFFKFMLAVINLPADQFSDEGLDEPGEKWILKEHHGWKEIES